MKVNYDWPKSIKQEAEKQEIESKIKDDIISSLDNEPLEINVFIEVNQREQQLEGSAKLPNGNTLLTFSHSLLGSQVSTYVSKHEA